MAKFNTYKITGGGLAEEITIEATNKTFAIKEVQKRLKPIFGNVPSNRFKVKLIKNKYPKLNGVPQSFEGKFFGLPFKLINQYTIDNKVEILFYDNRPKGEIVAIIKDNSKLDMLIDSVASWLYSNYEITDLYASNPVDVKEAHKRLKPFLSNLLQEVKKYNKKPVTKKIKPEKDKATIQKLTNSLKEGELILRSGRINNRKLEKEELKAVERTVNNTKKKLGIKKATVKKPRVKKTRQTITTSARQTGSSNLVYDKRKQAKAPGKRISESGNTYYEYRANRSDKGYLTGINTTNLSKELEGLENILNFLLGNVLSIKNSITIGKKLKNRELVLIKTNQLKLTIQKIKNLKKQIVSQKRLIIQSLKK